jgi:Tol biopolymer transport system component
MAATSADGRKVGTYPYQGAVWSPSGEQFAFVAGDDVQESVFVMNLEGQSQLIFTPGRDERLIFWHPAWSPDGKRLAVIVAQEDEEGIVFTLVVVDVAAQQTLSRHVIPDGTLLIPFSMSPPNNFRWSPDGQKILISWENAVVIDLENERTLSISDQPVVAEWTPEGDGVFYFTIGNYDRPGGRALGGFFLRKLDGGDPVQLMDASALAEAGLIMAPGFHYALMILSPSASKLAFVGGAEKEGSSSLRIYDLKPRENLTLDQPAYTFQLDTPVTALEWSPDEESVAVVAFEQDFALAIKLLNVATAEWQELVKLQIDWGDGGVEWLALFKIISWTQ